MSEGQVLSGTESANLGLRRAEALTAGARLKALREAAGMHIGVLSATLKVPQARLEALEADRLSELPDATFARALAKAVCRVLKVDAAEILALLPASTEPGLERVSMGLNQPFKAQALGGEGVGLGALRKPVVLAPLGLLLAAAAVYLLPADLGTRWWGPASGSSSPASGAEPAFDPLTPPAAEAASAAVPLAQAVLPQQSASSAGPAPASAATATETAAALAPAPAPVSAPIDTARPALATASAPVLPKPAVAGSGTQGLVPLLLRTSADSWVEVVDARGQVQYSRLMRTGEVADLQVQTPVKVRVGNVSGTSLSLRGEPVDLLARARDNVARLELP